MRRGGRGARSADDERGEQDHDADDDEAVGEVEDPDVHQFKSMKSVTCPSRIRSKRFERLPPITSPSAAGSTGWRAPERAKNASIQTIAAAVTTTTIAVAPENSPNAMPGVLDVMDRERPDDVHRLVERDRRRDDVLRHLVGRDRRHATSAKPAHCQRVRAERALRDRDRREPVGRRADPNVVRGSRIAQASALRWSSMQSRAHGIAASRPAPIGFPHTSHVP